MIQGGDKGHRQQNDCGEYISDEVAREHVPQMFSTDLNKSVKWVMGVPEEERRIAVVAQNQSELCFSRNSNEASVVRTE